jgi:hypothetical protein
MLSMWRYDKQTFQKRGHYSMSKRNTVKQNPFAKIVGTACAVLACVVLTAMPASALQRFTFLMVRSPALNAFPNFVPNAVGSVTITTIGIVEVMDVTIQGLPPNTDFDFFVIQAPNSPFGLCWYQSDIETDSRGIATIQLVGRFSIETFIVAPGVAPAPLVFGGMFPSVATNPQTGPVQIYHLGLWFNSPADAVKAGGPPTVTPFNGEHNAGVQVLNTSNFPFTGPLSAIQ